MRTPQLLAIVEVPRDDRVRCQADGCNHPVFRRIHVIRNEGAVHVVGSECFKKLFGALPVASATPHYTTSDGRHLTDEERRLLIENTERLIQQFEAELKAKQQAELARQAALAAAYRPPAPALPPPPPPLLPPPVSAASRQLAEAEAKQIVRTRYGVDPDLPGWRGLVLKEVRRLLSQNAGSP